VKPIAFVRCDALDTFGIAVRAVEDAGGTVRVRVKVRHGNAQVVISNSLPDMPSSPGAGIALANVRERLSLLHDFGASLETWSSDGQYHARVTVPI